MKRIWWSAVLLLSLSTWVGSAGASLSHRDWTVRLLNNTHSVSAAEPIRLELPQSLPTPVRAALHFELDDVSITDAIVFDAGVATYRPIQPLAEGSHRLRLVYAPDRGRWRELGVWQFAVKQDSDTGGDATAVASKRAVTPFGAFAELELEVADDEVKESDREDSPEKFLATLRAGQMQARVGPQKLAYNSLIHKDLDRPGAVAEWDLGEQIQIRGFGVSSQADSGYKRLVGTDDARYQLNGVLVEQQLPSYGDNQFSMVSGWVSGTARSKGSEQHGGSAWSVAGNASMLSNQLRLHAEYAGSEFEWDRSAADTKEVDAGQAYAMSMEYHATEDAPHKWHVGTQYSEVTPWFGSLGNPTLSTDRINLRTYGGITVDEWQFDAAIDRRRNNLEEDPAAGDDLVTDRGALLRCARQAVVQGGQRIRQKSLRCHQRQQCRTRPAAAFDRPVAAERVCSRRVAVGHARQGWTRPRQDRRGHQCRYPHYGFRRLWRHIRRPADVGKAGAVVAAQARCSHRHDGR